MVGGIQLAMGAMKLGFVANLLSRPIIAGLTSAAAFIISFSQAGTLLGTELGSTHYFPAIVWEAGQHLGETHLLSFSLGLASIGGLVALARWLPQVPGALVVVIGGGLAGWLFQLDQHGVEVVGTVPSGLPAVQVFHTSLQDLNALLPTAVTLALVQFLKNISLGQVLASRHDYTINANWELVALGASNLLGSFSQSLPASGSFSRSAVNDQVGAETPLSNVFTGGVIALTLLFLTPLFYYLPMPVLAAIIVVAGIGLIDVRELRALFRTRRQDGYIALFTAGCTLFIGIKEGILLGIGASLVTVLYRMSRPNAVELGHVHGTQQFRELSRFPQAVRIDEILLLRVDASFSFANADYFSSFILENSKQQERPVKAVIVDGSSINDLDTTAIEELISIAERLAEDGIELHLTGLIGPVRETVRRSPLHSVLGEEQFHLNPHQAVASVLDRLDTEADAERLQEYLETTGPDHTQPTPTAT
jgi:SulP family sulfate permease